MCALLVGLPHINVVAVDDRAGGPITVHVESRLKRAWCPDCGVRATIKDRTAVELVDIPGFGRSAGWCGPSTAGAVPKRPAAAIRGPVGDRIAAPRFAITDRAARWAAVQVGRLGRSVSEVAGDLGCVWHTVND